MIMGALTQIKKSPFSPYERMGSRDAGYNFGNAAII